MKTNHISRLLALGTVLVLVLCTLALPAAAETMSLKDARNAFMDDVIAHLQQQGFTHEDSAGVYFDNDAQILHINFVTEDEAATYRALLDATTLESLAAAFIDEWALPFTTAQLCKNYVQVGVRPYRISELKAMQTLLHKEKKLDIRGTSVVTKENCVRIIVPDNKEEQRVRKYIAEHPDTLDADAVRFAYGEGAKVDVGRFYIFTWRSVLLCAALLVTVGGIVVAAVFLLRRKRKSRCGASKNE